MSTMKDPTFRTDRNGNMIIAQRAELVINAIEMLFNMVPGTDEYEPKRGLNISAKLKQSYLENTRDTSYESEIADQITNYTTMVPMSVVAAYKEKCLFIFLSVKFEDEIYNIDLTASTDTLTSMLRN